MQRQIHLPGGGRDGSYLSGHPGSSRFLFALICICTAAVVPFSFGLVAAAQTAPVTSAVSLAKPAPIDRVLDAVSCTSANACEAVGYYVYKDGVELPRAMTWNGTHWAVQHISASANGAFYAISCPDSTHCEAVGDTTGVWDGTTWAQQHDPDVRGSEGSELVSLSCTSADFCIAVGSYENFSDATQTLAEVWNGTKWTVQKPPDPAGKDNENFLNGVSCTSADSCEAVGNYVAPGSLAHYLPLAEVWNGAKWAVQSVPSPSLSTGNTLRSVSCTSADDCEAVGTYTAHGSDASLTLAEVWNGTNWAWQNTPGQLGISNAPEALPQGWNLFGVSCAGSAACEAVGTYTNGGSQVTPLAEGWNGTEWALQDTPILPSGGNLAGVSCTSATACEAVGAYTGRAGSGLSLMELWNGTQWAMQR